MEESCKNLVRLLKLIPGCETVKNDDVQECMNHIKNIGGDNCSYVFLLNSEYTLCKVEGQLEGSKQQYNRYHVSSSFNNNIFIQQSVYISSSHSTHNANCYITLSSQTCVRWGFTSLKWNDGFAQLLNHVNTSSLDAHHCTISKKNVKECSLNQSYYNMTPVWEHMHLFLLPQD